MEKKKSNFIMQIMSIAFFAIIALGSAQATYPTGGNSGSSNDMYSQPAKEGECAVCGGRGYIIRNGVKETCSACGGTGKATSFPTPK